VDVDATLERLGLEAEPGTVLTGVVLAV